MDTSESDIDEHFLKCNDAECAQCGNDHRHCKWCSKILKSPYDRKRHFKQSHLSHAVLHNNIPCYPCKQNHNGESKSERAHYHCPVCMKTVMNKGPFENHLSRHERAHKKNGGRECGEEQEESCRKAQQNENDEEEKAGKKENDDKEEQKAEKKKNGDDEEEKTGKKEDGEEEKARNIEDGDDEEKKAGREEDDGENDKRTKPARRETLKQKECPHCGKMMHEKSLGRHCKSFHDDDFVAKATCVDVERGLFLVRRSSHGGVGFPIHVKKVLVKADEGVGVECEDDSCMDVMKVAWRSGLKTAECNHLKEVGRNPVFQDSEVVTDDALDDISPNGEYKLLKRERIDQCRELQEQAESDKAELVVSVRDGRFIHFSVYDGNVHYYAKFARVVVTADVHNGSLDCRCCRRKRPCVHKSICLWYLRQHNLLDSFMGNEELGSSSYERDMSGEAPETDQLYPPDDPELIRKMCTYLHETKKIPIVNSSCRAPPIICKKFIPKEENCYLCEVPLGKPIKITSRASILTMTSLSQDVTTYFKRCPQCNVCYRYQEHDIGIHNFNDIFLIGIDVCDFLRDSLQQHLPIGSIVKVMENRVGRQLDSQLVINAFLHFDSLSDHGYNYHCSLCGFHPVTLIFDLNKKVTFGCSASDLQLPDDYDEEETDHVNVEEFWRKVELCMVARGFSEKRMKEFEVQPSLLSWAPFISRKTRKGDFVLNTEHRKVNRKTGELEKDCRDITEERLMELLQDRTYAEVQSFARSLGAQPKGSKLDLIMKIKNFISKDQEKFQKAFSKLWGCSGGWVSGACPHGVIYTLKFVLRSESPRDYADLLLSMDHQPNVTVIDMANMLAAHGNKRQPDMFHPHNGMVVAPSEENIKQARDGNLLVSLPWLSDSETANQQPSSAAERQHPVSGSDTRLCLFDRLHERNVKKDVEVLRRITNIKELKGKLNSQKDEQIHSSYNHDSRYLNQMKPVNHIFLFRSNIDIRNDRINSRLTEAIKEEHKHEVQFDKNGRVGLDLKKRIFKNVKRKRIETGISEDNPPSPPPCKMSKTEASAKGTPSDPIDLSEVPLRDLQNPDRQWIADLDLRNRDRTDILDGRWLNDRVINAAMHLMKGKAGDVNGLEDVIIAKKDGFSSCPGVEGFVQILCIRNCHWITISNLYTMHKFPRRACIYDSSYSMSERLSKNDISYPIHLDTDVFRLLRPSEDVSMCVLNVQQQKGGDDCGLFAIAYAALLCLGKSPVPFHYKQEAMRPALVKSLEEGDIATFMDVVTTPKEVEQEVLYQWVMRLYCRCRSPDDGKEMQQCSRCHIWYHNKCESLDESDDHWMCFSCKNERNAEGAEQYLKALQNTSKKHQETGVVQQLHQAIVRIIDEDVCPVDNIGTMTTAEYEDISCQTTKRSLLGLCEPIETIPLTFFIVIFPDQQSNQSILETLIHEMAHALHYKKDPYRYGVDQDHGKTFQRIAKTLATKVLKRKQELPKPFLECEIDPKIVALARKHT